MLNERIRIPEFIVVPCHFSQLHNKTIIAFLEKALPAHLLKFRESSETGQVGERSVFGY
jgi:hypothetical protein